MDAISQFFAQGAIRVDLEGPRATLGDTISPRVSADIPPQGFRIVYRQGDIAIDYADDAGLAAALDMVEVLGEDVSFDNAVEVRDAPLMTTRSYLMDLSGDRIVSWEVLVRRVNMLERLRYNQLELRIGHAFTYRDQDAAWEGSSPLTASQLRHIESLCQAHGIRLVTAIEPITHWERWLSLPEYADRAEMTHGRHGHDGRYVPPSELAATSDNASFVADLVGQLTQALSNRRINVGGHSTQELGQGRSKELVEGKGLGTVIVDFLESVGRSVAGGIDVAEMWSDVLREDPELLERIPSRVVPIVRCADPPSSMTKGYEEAGAPLVGSHREFWVAPGTATWNSLCGRHDHARANIDDALTWGITHSATGILLTSWAGRGHWAPEVLNLPAMVTAAVGAWRGHLLAEDELVSLMSALVAPDVALAVLRLGELPSAAPIPVRNTDVSWEALRRGGYLPGEWGIGVDEVARARAVLKEVRRVLENRQGMGSTLLRAQVRHCADLSEFGLVLIDRAQGRDSITVDECRVTWARLVERQKKLWLASARDGGLEHSLAQLDPIAAVE